LSNFVTPLNFGDLVSPSQFGSLHHCSFISLVTTLVFSFWYNHCVLTASDTALVDTTVTSGHINNNDSDERNSDEPDGDEQRRWATATATADTAATSGHVDDNDSNKQDIHNDDQDEDKADTMTTRQSTGNTPTTMNMTMATDGITVADTMTTGTAGTTRTSGSSDINVAPPAIPTSIVAQPWGGPIAFLEERAALLSQHTSEAAAVAREAVTYVVDFNNAHASIVAKHHIIGFLTNVHNRSRRQTEKNLWRRKGSHILVTSIIIQSCDYLRVYSIICLTLFSNTQHNLNTPKRQIYT
jgi:hypothetical protein